MDWATLNPALLALFTNLGADERTRIGPDTEHKDRPGKIIGVASKQALTLQVMTVRGLDASRVVTFDSATQEQTESVEATCVVTYRLVCDSILSTDKGWAWTTIERIRLRLRRTRTYEALLALNASLVRCLPSQEANYRSDGKINNRVLMDVQLLVRVTESDPDPLDWIQSVVITSDKIKDVDGTDLPAPLQMTDVVVDGAGDPP